MELAHPKLAQPKPGPFGLESAIDFDTTTRNNASQPSYDT